MSSRVKGQSKSVRSGVWNERANPLFLVISRWVVRPRSPRSRSFFCASSCVWAFLRVNRDGNTAARQQQRFLTRIARDDVATPGASWPRRRSVAAWRTLSGSWRCGHPSRRRRRARHCSGGGRWCTRARIPRGRAHSSGRSGKRASRISHTCFHSLESLVAILCVKERHRFRR